MWKLVQNMENKHILCITLFIAFIGCNNSPNDDKNKSIPINIFKAKSEQMESYLKLKEKIITMGDTESYSSLSTASLDNPTEDFLPWALVMANKYHFTQAYLDVYFCLNSMSNEFDKNDVRSLKLLDNKTRTMAIEYLKKAAEQKHPQAMSILGHYYVEGRYLIKDEKLGNNLIVESEKLFKELYNR